MDVIVSYCGLVCQSCPIYWATREQDKKKREKMRAEIARVCNEQYGIEYKPEDITDCDGCQIEDGRLFSGCNKCEIRICARQKGLENCAHCSNYACEKLQEFFTEETHAKAVLEVIRSTITK